MTDLIDRLRLGDGTSPDHWLLLEAADALEKSVECMCGICKLGLQRKPLTDGSVFIAVSNYRRKTPSGKKDRTPHYDGISWIHSIVGVSRTKEGAENMAKAAEDAYRDTYPAYKTPGHDPMYVWEVEELAIEAAHGIKE